MNLQSLLTFQPDFVKTTKDKILAVSNREFNDWLGLTINKDIYIMVKAANHMMSNNMRIYTDMLIESPADSERKGNLTQQLDGVMIQTTNEIAAESLKAHRLLFNYQSILSSYEKFSTDLFKKNALEHIEHVVMGFETILSHLFGTLNIFSSIAISAIDSETKAVIEGRPTRFDYMHKERKKTEIARMETNKTDSTPPPPPSPTATLPGFVPTTPATPATGTPEPADPKKDATIEQQPSKDPDVIEI